MAGAAVAMLPALLSMLQKPNTTNFSSQVAPMIGAESSFQQSLLDMMAKATPQFTPLDVNGLNKIVNDQSLLSALQSKMAERQLDPALAQMRETENQDLLGDYENAKSGNLPVGVQNALVRAGLGAAANAGSTISPTSIGKGSAERVFGQGSTEYLDKLRNLVMNKTSSTARPQVSLDPGAAADITASNVRDRDNLNNQFQQQLLQATGQAHTNLSNFGQSLVQGGIREGLGNTAAKNAKQAQFISSLSGGAGSAIGGMGTGALK